MNTYNVECDIIGLTPIGFSRAIQSQRNTGEPFDSYEERIWKERVHTDQNGDIFIPPMALKLCLSDCAKYLSESVPGKGKATYTKHFDAGVMLFDPLYIGINVKDLKYERLFLPVDGRRGGNKRVWKLMPRIMPWKCHAKIYVMDQTIKPEKLSEYLGYAGQFIGLGFFRPRRGGFWGKFKVENLSVSNGI